MTVRLSHRSWPQRVQWSANIFCGREREVCSRRDLPFQSQTITVRGERFQRIESIGRFYQNLRDILSIINPALFKIKRPNCQDGNGNSQNNVMSGIKKIAKCLVRNATTFINVHNSIQKTFIFEESWIFRHCFSCQYGYFISNSLQHY